MKKITENEFLRKFGNENACLKALLNYRAKSDGSCFNPNCRGGNIGNYKLIRNRKGFYCPSCYEQYYPMSGTIFEHSHISLSDWFHIVYKMLSSRNGISANEIKDTKGYSYRTAFRILEAIRSQMSKSVQEKFTGVDVEADESFIRTGNKGTNKNTYLGKGRGNKKHSQIFAIVERQGPRTRFFMIPDASGETLIDVIKSSVENDCIIYTDCWDGYSGLGKEGYKHITVNHEERFVEGTASTNRCEGMFGHLKRILKGTHRNISHRKAQLYLDEFSFRHSYRECEDYGFEIFLKSFSNTAFDNYLDMAA